MLMYDYSFALLDMCKSATEPRSESGLVTSTMYLLLMWIRKKEEKKKG